MNAIGNDWSYPLSYSYIVVTLCFKEWSNVNIYEKLRSFCNVLQRIIIVLPAFKYRIKIYKVFQNMCQKMKGVILWLILRKNIHINMDPQTHRFRDTGCR